MSVIVGYVHGGMLHNGFAKSLRELYLFDKGPDGRHLIGGECEVQGLYVADSRNHVCRKFLGATYPDGTKPQWLFFLDTDIVFKPQEFYSILDAADPVERPIVGGLYFGYLDGQPVPVWRKIHHELGGQWGTMAAVNIGTIEPIDAVGMGFTVIHRSVLDGFPDTGDTWRWFAHDLYGQERLGEDLTFCHRAAKHGFTTWGDTRVVVRHIKPFAISLSHFIEASEKHAKSTT